MKNPVNYLFLRGLYVYLQNDVARIHGMGRICPEQREKLLEYAKAYKSEIIETLSREIPRCLGFVCGHVEYREADEMPNCLWCGRAEKLVFDLEECPEGYWKKD